jgi:hypothetical protein
LIGGRAPFGSDSSTGTTAGEFNATIPTNAAATPGIPAFRVRRLDARRSLSHLGTSRSSGRARETTVSARSSATFAANSLVVGAIRIPASKPSEIP